MFSLLLNQFSAMSEAEGLCWLVLDGLVTPGIFNIMVFELLLINLFGLIDDL